MHELSIIAGLFETLLDQARAHNAREITRVRLKVGLLSGIVPELLESAFDMYKKGTLAEKADLDIEIVPLSIRCRACAPGARRATRRRRSSWRLTFLPPACASSSI